MDRIMEIKHIVDKRLFELFDNDLPRLLWDSMYYSVEAGGKRLRPVLNILAAELLTDEPLETLDIACAIELIHTYSLVHDDLPAMDDDNLRRGKPTNHIVFGEAQAILAGDGLLNYAFEVMLANALHYSENSVAHLNAINTVAVAAGVKGMVAGQAQDVALEGMSISEEELLYIHTHKTGAMIRGALVSGLELYSPTQEQLESISVFGEKLGLVFQIVDDVLDIKGGELGKTAGKDAAKGKTTFPTLYGIEGSLARAKELTFQATAALEIFGSRASVLTALAKDMLERVS